MNINDQQPVTEGLRFGTAGLRAPVGPGAQEMNVTQVTRTTAGVASWLAERAAARAASGAQQHHPDPDTEALLGEIHGNIDDGALKVAVGFDARYAPTPSPSPPQRCSPGRVSKSPCYPPRPPPLCLPGWSNTEGWTRACKSPPATTPPPTMDTKST